MLLLFTSKKYLIIKEALIFIINASFYLWYNRLIKISIIAIVFTSCSQGIENIVTPPVGKMQYKVINEYYINKKSNYEFVKSKTAQFNASFNKENNITVFSWELQIPYYLDDSINIKGLEVETSFSNGYVIKYSLDKNHKLHEIINWDDIYSYSDSLKEIYYKPMIDSASDEMKQKLNEFIEVYNKKENLENRLGKEVYLFNKVYGLPKTIDSSIQYLTSLNGVDEVVEKVFSYFKESFIESYFFTSEPTIYNLEINKNYLSVINHAEINSLKTEVIDSCIFDLNTKTSWPSRIIYWRNITIDTLKIKEVTFIEPNGI